MGHEGQFFLGEHSPSFFLKSAIRSQKGCKETFFVVSNDVRNSVYFSNNTGLWGWRRQVDRDFGGTDVLGVCWM